MIQKKQLSLAELGELAAVIPGPEPELMLPNDAKGIDRPIPVSEPTLGGNTLRYVTRCIETNWISSIGAYVTQFEEQFAACCGVPYGVATSNGTTALHLALATLGLQEGDEVIIPTFTMIATANAVAYTGAKPVLVDSEPATWNMDPGEVEAKVTARTKAVIPMHTYGHPVDMDPILALAKQHGLYVIEDAAEAHGARYKGRPAGSMGHCAAFSFYGNKIISTGEGGMVVTDNKEIAEVARSLRDHAFSKDRHFWHQYRGFNYRMTNVQAAIGLAQVEQFDELVGSRIRHAQHYNRLLADVPGLTLPPETPDVKNVYWMYGILVGDEFGLTRDELRQALAKRGVETRTFFVPMHLQPVYFHDHEGERYPVSEDLCGRGLYLPSSSSLTDPEIEYVAAQIKEARP